MKLREYIINEEKNKTLNKAKIEAEKKLKSFKFKVLSDYDIFKWNKNRNIGGDVNTRVDIKKLKWVDHGGFLKKSFYIKDVSGKSFGIMREAIAYYENNGAIYYFIITDESGIES